MLYGFRQIVKGPCLDAVLGYEPTALIVVQGQPTVKLTVAQFCLRCRRSHVLTR